MDILLLAAGMGTRLGPQTEFLPKSLVPVLGKPLLHRILDSLLSFPIGKIVLVAGFEQEKITQAVKPYGPKVKIVYNPDFKKGNLLTVLCGRGKMTAPFAIFNADHHYSKTILNKILSHKGDAICAVCDFDRPLTDDDMKVRLNPDGLSMMSKKLERPDGGYVGVTLVPEAREKIYWDTASAVLKESGDSSHAEMVLNRLASHDEKVEILDISGSVWIEIDTPEDLAAAEQKMKLIE
ncbi:MAG: phosphocholine cytidylyltransferase family protein [Deltaproteobacteria bacterium]|nr:phosphocholine cytidylyltransferase family protein [Deltaproteobacteria bacterium]